MVVVGRTYCRVGPDRSLGIVDLRGLLQPTPHAKILLEVADIRAKMRSDGDCDEIRKGHTHVFHACLLQGTEGILVRELGAYGLIPDGVK
jgi:hypothetical protein